jgi:hypothetical protein
VNVLQGILRRKPGGQEEYGGARLRGAEVTMPLADQFWGERFGQLRDPFGHKWAIRQPISKPSQTQIEEADKAAFPEWRGSWYPILAARVLREWLNRAALPSRRNR